MVKDLIGYRFSPTGEELVNHYLKNKNLGNTCLVDEAISEINILNYIPEDLPGLAKIQSDDLKWYFFSRIEYRNAKKKAMKRSTGSGFWKPTGKDRIIRDKRRNGVEVGLKKTVRYYEGRVANGVWTPWVMHEYHITCLPHDQRTYVICKVKKKDIGGDIRSGGNYSSEPSPSLVSDSNTIRAMINTAPGFWKPTGKDRIIRDKRRNGVEIGLKKTLVYHERKALNGVRTDWVMHEYHITCLPHDQRTYVICQVMYKDEDGDIPSGGNYSSEPSQSLVSDSNTIRVTSIPPVFQVEQQPGQDNYYGLSENDLRTPLNEQADLSECDGFDPNTFFSDDNNNHVQLQTPYLPQDDSEFMCGLPSAYRAIAQHLLSDQDSIMQEEYNDYMLMNTVTAETITTASEYEQPGQDNYYGLSADELRVPINEQVDLFPPDAFDPNTLFSDYNHPNLQQQTPYNDDYWSGLLGYNGENFEDVVSDQESIMQEEYNDYMLMNTVTATSTTASEPQAPHLAPDDYELLGGLRHVDRGQVEYLSPNEEFVSRLTTSMTENRNDHRPKKPLSGIIVDYSSDSDIDAESISAMSYQGTSSPGDSVGSSNRHSQTGLDEIISFSKDLQTSDEPSISRKTRESQLARRTIPSKQEVKHNTSRAADASIDKESSMVKTEKKGWFIREEAMERNHKNPWYIHLMRMIIGFILLLAFIGNIISVLLTVQT